jgi:uncharacterized protein YukE
MGHQDIGQKDKHVRLYEDMLRTGKHNSTIVLILCREKDRTTVKNLVLGASEQLFASKYMKYLRNAEELIKELEDVSHRIKEIQAAYVCYKQLKMY